VLAQGAQRYRSGGGFVLPEDDEDDEDDEGGFDFVVPLVGVDMVGVGREDVVPVREEPPTVRVIPPVPTKSPDPLDPVLPT